MPQRGEKIPSPGEAIFVLSPMAKALAGASPRPTIRIQIAAQPLTSRRAGPWSRRRESTDSRTNTLRNGMQNCLAAIVISPVGEITGGSKPPPYIWEAFLRLRFRRAVTAVVAPRSSQQAARADRSRMASVGRGPNSSMAVSVATWSSR